jgi:hypothetical protein
VNAMFGMESATLIRFAFFNRSASIASTNVRLVTLNTLVHVSVFHFRMLIKLVEWKFDLALKTFLHNLKGWVIEIVGRRCRGLRFLV